MTKDKTKDLKLAFISMRVEHGLYDDFRLVAISNERSVSAELRMLMRRHVEEAATKEAAA